ncbi:BrnT family toxin [Jannaschia sp. LMIT008]|uniref:BrnT family toxin n=1 Tax=Jannaschia maritima TaxID=3032585 RepID=UPI002810BAE2|nr:BrnT family toxin [Jannaschia sp. LMIT008]
MEFEWDEAKARANYDKHGVRLDVGLAVFLDPDRIEWRDDRHDYGESRTIILGLIDDRLHCVVVTSRDDGRTMRLISVCKADKREIRRYGQNRPHDA